VAQHVRPDPAKLRRLIGHPDDVVHGLAGELRLPLGDEEPGKIVLAGGEVALDGAQLVAVDVKRSRLWVARLKNSLSVEQPTAVANCKKSGANRAIVLNRLCIFLGWRSLTTRGVNMERSK